ncbi:hypothetical protein CDL15_Pgr018978 [Punica granatum]|uniref:Uncharacterized protein n=1 Tax=Punica granatum TaxID=22663 RepID=A0A218XKF8_PUNGR|nr:hypothetical protein CDL15_Pgr018978 [Punica granatum]
MPGGRTNPDDDRAGPDQLIPTPGESILGQPGLSLSFRSVYPTSLMSSFYHRLELRIPLMHDPVILVVEAALVSNPCFDDGPNLQPINGKRAVFYQQANTVWRILVLNAERLNI